MFFKWMPSIPQHNEFFLQKKKNQFLSLQILEQINSGHSFTETNRITL